MNDEKIDLPFPTVSCDYYMNIPKVEPEVIGFHLPSEPYGCFSNWFLAPVVYAGREYSSTEQFMMYQKVMLAGNYTLADQIRVVIWYQVLLVKERDNKTIIDK